MRSCGLLTLNYIKMTSIDLLKEIESWLSFNTEPSKEETAKLRKSIKEHLAEQLRIHDVVGRSEQLKAFADYAQKRMWEDGDKDLSEFVDEFLRL